MPLSQPKPDLGPPPRDPEGPHRALLERLAPPEKNEDGWTKRELALIAFLLLFILLMILYPKAVVILLIILLGIGLGPVIGYIIFREAQSDDPLDSPLPFFTRPRAERRRKRALFLTGHYTQAEILSLEKDGLRYTFTPEGKAPIRAKKRFPKAERSQLQQRYKIGQHHGLLYDPIDPRDHHLITETEAPAPK